MTVAVFAAGLRAAGPRYPQVHSRHPRRSYTGAGSRIAPWARSLRWIAAARLCVAPLMIARHLLWKVPRRIGGVVNFKMLLLTRMGEALFKYLRPGGVENFLHGPANGLRGRMVNSIGSASVRQFGLRRAQLVPPGQMEDIVRGAIGLATEGFFEGVADGRIVVRANRTIARLLADSDQPAAELDDGTRLPADLIVCATGFSQGVPFLPPGVTGRVFDERGNFMLYRQIRPADVPDLYFNWYDSSFFSPLNAEMAAVWIAADLAGAVALPDPADMRQQIADQLAFTDGADRHPAHCARRRKSRSRRHPPAPDRLDRGGPWRSGRQHQRRVSARTHWLDASEPRGAPPAITAREAAGPTASGWRRSRRKTGQTCVPAAKAREQARRADPSRDGASGRIAWDRRRESE